MIILWINRLFYYLDRSWHKETTAKNETRPHIEGDSGGLTAGQCIMSVSVNTSCLLQIYLGILQVSSDLQKGRGSREIIFRGRYIYIYIQLYMKQYNQYYT